MCVCIVLYILKRLLIKNKNPNLSPYHFISWIFLFFFLPCIYEVKTSFNMSNLKYPLTITWFTQSWSPRSLWLWMFKNDTSRNSPGLIQPCSDHLCDQEKLDLIPFYLFSLTNLKEIHFGTWFLRQTSLSAEKFVFDELNLSYKAAVCFQTPCLWTF